MDHTAANGQARDLPKVIAAVDIGSNSVRMVVAQVLAEGGIEILERTQRAVRLGQDTFTRGRLSQATTRAAVDILRDYRQICDTYRVDQVRAVATSAVREAANADPFIDRIYMATGLDVEIIEPTEESRLTVGAVLASVGDELGIGKGHTLIVDVGGGSSLLTHLESGEISASAGYRLGSIRLQEILDTSHEPPEKAADLLRHEIATGVSAVRSAMPLRKVKTFVAVGGDARLAAGQVGGPSSAADLREVAVDALDRFVDGCAGYPPEALARRYNIPFADAETLVPALLTYQQLLHATRAKAILVSDVSMRDGLVLDMARSVRGEDDEAMTRSVLQSAETIGEKYAYDAAHAVHVGDLAVRFFDALTDEHGLSSRYRLLLRVAATVHDVGAYVSNRAHHKHSYYLISNAEIFGLRRDELDIVAQVARYHRRSCPKASHQPYMSLPREKRMVVAKLAAVLRVADALDRGHGQQVRDLYVEKPPGEFVIYVRGVSDLTLERRALAVKSDLFEDIYGRHVRLEEADLKAEDLRRARSVE